MPAVQLIYRSSRPCAYDETSALMTASQLCAGSVRVDIPETGVYHIRVLIPCYKEEADIVEKTVHGIRNAVLPPGASWFSRIKQVIWTLAGHRATLAMSM